jgi:hypothetical protein
MLRFRFPIASPMIGIIFFGVSLAALKDSSIFWNSLFFSMTGGMLVVSILFAVYQEERERAFWLGFAVLGWGHFLLAFWGNEVPFLLTDYALKSLQEQVIGLRESTNGGGVLDLDGISRQIALSIVTLVIAFLGGHVTARIVAARVARRQRHE